MVIGWKCFLQAEDGIGLPEQILDQSNFQTAAKSYFVFIQFDFIWSLNYFAMIILNFLEVGFFLFPLFLVTMVVLSRYLFILNFLNSMQKPLWCTNYSTDSCNDRDYYFLGQLPYLTGEESLIYEVRVRYLEELWPLDCLWHMLLLYYSFEYHWSWLNMIGMAKFAKKNKKKI